MSSQNTEGLANVVAGESAISTVGQGSGLNYRGYGIVDLSTRCSFEQVAYLLLFGKLPEENELVLFQRRMEDFSKRIDDLLPAIEKIPKEMDPMDALHAIVMLASAGLPEKEDFSNQLDVVIRLLGIYIPATIYWYNFAKFGLRIDPSKRPGESMSRHLLRLLSGKEPSVLNERALDACFTLYAEHEFNASTFVARVCASTLSDMYSCIAAAIGTLKGKLHGGANEASISYLERLKNLGEADEFLESHFKRKELVMGFGHRIYKNGDPRHAIVKDFSHKVSKLPGGDQRLHALGEHIEGRMVKEKKIHPNLDFFAAILFRQLGIPKDLSTVLFAFSRTTGWAAHVMEQRQKNRLIRPSSKYTGPTPRPLPARFIEPKL